MDAPVQALTGAMARPKVSVIVPHYNDPTRLDHCLAALERQSLPREAFEIVVADNASPQGRAALEDIIAGRAVLTIVAEAGAGLARNGGVAASRGGILAFTDCDCLPSPAWLEAGLSALSEADFVGGAMAVTIERPGRPTAVEAFETVFAFDNERYVRRKGFSVTANLFCRREVFDAVGPFRTGVSEDTEWAHRALRLGYSIGYAPAALVAHPARRNWPELAAKWRRIQAESYGLAAESPAGRLVWGLRTLVLPVSAVVHGLRVLTTPRLAGGRQRLGALMVLWRLRLWRTWDSVVLLTGSRRP
ncbi:MAG TPA: glycosyltransferase [Caulobacteraceae bacterium]|nr:glycosyltransferase [Caulobacteraceae bacterium]